MEWNEQRVVRDESSFDPAGDVSPMIQCDSLELSFTPLLRWRDALLRLFGLTIPAQIVAIVTVKKVGVIDGQPSVIFNCTYKGDTRRVLRPECGQARAPEGWWCERVRGHDGPCASMPIDEAVATRHAPLEVLKAGDFCTREQAEIIVEEIRRQADLRHGSTPLFNDLTS